MVMECVHGMGDPAWCRICVEASTRAAVPTVLPDVQVRGVVVGAAHAIRQGDWEPSGVRLQNSAATDGTEVSHWRVTFDTAPHEVDLEFYRARDLVMEIQMRFREGPERFIGLHRRHRLGVQRHAKGWWSSLRNQSIYLPNRPDRCQKRTPDIEQLSGGAGVDDATAMIEAAGGAVVERRALGQTKRGGSVLAVLAAEGNQAPHVTSFLLSRILPIYHRYEG